MGIKVFENIEFRTEKLHELLHKIVADNISTADLNLFITYCQALSKTNLIHEIQHGRLNLDQSLSSQTQLDDFSLDCIADLFARNQRGEFYLIKRVFEPKLTEIDASPQTATVLLRKLIASRVHQSLISLFSRVDQGGWKIWRNLSLVTKRHPHIHEFKYMSNCYFYYAESRLEEPVPTSLNPNGIELSDELLSDWLQTNLKEKYGLPQAIEGVFKNLSKYEDHQQFLERGRLFYSLKQHLNLSYTDIGEMETLGSGDAHGLDEVQSGRTVDLIPKLKKHIDDEILSTYESKGKISRQLSLQYSKIMEVYFSDLISDGTVEKLQQYLTLTDNQNLMNGEWLLHRGRLEYIIKMGKSWLRDEIKSDGIPTSSKMRVQG